MCTGTGTITYLWTQSSGPATLGFTGATTTTVVATGNSAFGGYVLDLAATDMAGTSHTTIEIGTVIASASGVIDTATELGATIGAKVSSLLRPMIRVGANSAPWYDDRHKAALDAAWGFYGSSGQPYGPWWKIFNTDSCNTGTVTMTGGSATITGSGTSFQTCLATAGWSGFIMTIRYTGTDARTHYFYRVVSATPSQTSMTIDEAYPLNVDKWGTLPNCNAGCAGLSFVISHNGGPVDQESRYWSGGTPEFYYDIGTAFYTYVRGLPLI